MLSSKDDISFRHELGSAHVKFDRLNQQSNLKYRRIATLTSSRRLFVDIHVAWGKLLLNKNSVFVFPGKCYETT